MVFNEVVSVLLNQIYHSTKDKEGRKRLLPPWNHPMAEAVECRIVMSKGICFELLIPRCDVLKDITHDYSGREIITLRICEQKNAMHKYTYKPNSGLLYKETIVNNPKPDAEGYEKSTQETEIEPDVMLALCSVYDCDSLITFIKQYGFFFWLPERGLYFSIPYESLNSLLENFKNALMLFQETMYETPNINRMISLIYKLMVFPQKSLTIQNATFRSGEHPFERIWNNITYAEQNIYKHESLAKMEYTDAEDPMDFPTPTYTAYDTFSDSYVSVRPAVYSEKSWLPDANLLYHLHMLYASIPTSMPSSRYMIDLLYHLYQDHALDISGDESACFFLNLQNFKCKGDQKSAYAKLLTKLASYVLKEEVDCNTCYAALQFDPEQQTALFYVPNLWCALHISLIDYKARERVYRKCANCHKYFVQNKKTTNKKYCSSTCRSYVSQGTFQRKHHKS